MLKGGREEGKEGRCMFYAKDILMQIFAALIHEFRGNGPLLRCQFYEV